MSSYYLRKYSFHYPFFEDDGTPMEMCTIGIPDLINIYKDRKGVVPRSFFDCGAAIGFMVMWAEKAGMQAHGIDVRRYNPNHYFADLTEPYFARKQIKIESILDTAPIQADLAYCNGTLTYMNETTLPLCLGKFKDVGMLIAIHNTTEDLIAAKNMGDPIRHSEPRLIRDIKWWIQTFHANGFAVDFDIKHQCFCAIPNKQAQLYPPQIPSAQYPYARTR